MAAEEFLASVEFYDSKNSALAQAFVDDVESAIDRIKQFPSRSPLVFFKDRDVGPTAQRELLWSAL